jgi:hypothetical protein
MTEQNRDLRSHPSFIIVWTDAAFAEGENRMKFLKNTMLMAFEPRGLCQKTVTVEHCVFFAQVVGVGAAEKQVPKELPGFAKHGRVHNSILLKSF